MSVLVKLLWLEIKGAAGLKNHCDEMAMARSVLEHFLGTVRGRLR